MKEMQKEEMAMEELTIYLTHEDAVKLEQMKSEQVAEYHMLDSEYATVLLHRILNPEEVAEDVV